MIRGGKGSDGREYGLVASAMLWTGLRTAAGWLAHVSHTVESH